MIKIRMVDSTCFGNWHLHFNSQLLVILSNIASVVEYRGVQKIGEHESNIYKKKILVISRTGRWAIPFRFILSFLMIFGSWL